jgi:glycerol-3-phosphate acyltransferase PlsY
MTNQSSPATTGRKELGAIPGLVGIAFYLVLLAAVITLGVVGHRYPLIFLLFSPVFLAASAGLLLLLRWAWALALAAVVLLACYNLWVFSTAHMVPALVQGALNTVFFLYLIRTEVRSRLR